MASASDTAHWCAIDLAPGQARAWAMQGDTALSEVRLDAPAGPSGPDTAAALIDRLCAAQPGHRGAPAVICGLAEGPAPVKIPAKPGEIAPARLAALGADALPGLYQDTPPAVMQGGETRIAGFLTLNPGWDGVICLPGPETHWALLSAEEVVSVQSFLSGDLVQALSSAPRLRAALEGAGRDQAGFDEAVDVTLSRPEKLAAGLAGIRAEQALGRLQPGQGRARLSGLLIGAELAAARAYWLGQQVAVIGPDESARAYADALQRQGVPVTLADEARMTRAGLCAAWRRATAAR